MDCRRLISMFGALLSGAIAIGGVSADTTHAHEAGHRDDQRQRHQGVHVHGSGTLNLALDGHQLYIELSSPAVNLVGFEHRPLSPADHAAVDRAVALLEQGGRLFRLNDEAGCRLQHAEILTAWPDDAHEQHAPQGHADLDATYRFECADPARLQRLAVELFTTFPGTTALQLQYIIGGRQGGASLTPSAHVVTF